jgi:hypothetical protein
MQFSRATASRAAAIGEEVGQQSKCTYLQFKTKGKQKNLTTIKKTFSKKAKLC